MDKENIENNQQIPEPTSELTEEQKEKILKRWNESPDHPPGLKELSQLVYGINCDGRDKYGRTIKKFLTSRQLKTKSIYEEYYKNRENNLKLTSEQKEFVRNHLGSSSPLEITRDLFQNRRG